MDKKKMIDMDYDDLIDAKIDVEFYTIPDNVVKSAIREVLKEYDLVKFPLAQYPYGFATEFVEAIPLLHWLEVYNSARLMDGNERRENGTFYLDLFGSNMFPVINPTIVCKELGIDGSFDRLWREIIDYVGRIFNHWERLEDDAFWIKARNHGKKKVYTYGLYQEGIYSEVIEYCVFTHTKKFSQKEFENMYNKCVVLCKKEWDVDNPCMANLGYWMNEKFGFEIFDPTVNFNIIDMEVEEIFVPSMERIKDKSDVKEIFSNLTIEQKCELKEMIENQKEEDIRNERISRIISTCVELSNETPCGFNDKVDEVLLVLQEKTRSFGSYLSWDVYDNLVINGVDMKEVPCVKDVCDDYSGLWSVAQFFERDDGFKTILSWEVSKEVDLILDEIENVLLEE